MNKQILQKNYDDMIFNMAIKALEQEIDEDIISRKVVKAEYKHKLESNLKDEERGIDLTEFADCTEFNKFIDSIPPVTLHQKIGRWIIKDGKEQGYDIAGTKTWYIQVMCDKCGFIKTAIEGHTGQYKFCPNCGQPKMQEGKE